jgi:hypothetical protein
MNCFEECNDETIDYRACALGCLVSCLSVSLAARLIIELYAIKTDAVTLVRI